MKIAKTISFIAFIYNIFLTFGLLRVFLELRLIFQELEIEAPFEMAWFLFVPPIIAIMSLSYWFYLKHKEKRGENVRFASWISLILLFISSFIISLLSPSNYIEPLYQLLKAIE